MELIQHLATRIVMGMRELPYGSRLPRLNIFSLHRRRHRGVPILSLNAYHGYIDAIVKSTLVFHEAPSPSSWLAA